MTVFSDQRHVFTSIHPRVVAPKTQASQQVCGFLSAEDFQDNWDLLHGQVIHSPNMAKSVKHWKSRSSRAVQEAHGEQPRESAPKFSAARVDRIDRVDACLKKCCLCGISCITHVMITTPLCQFQIKWNWSCFGGNGRILALGDV